MEISLSLSLFFLFPFFPFDLNEREHLDIQFPREIKEGGRGE